jgi:hypothetical protein
MRDWLQYSCDHILLLTLTPSRGLFVHASEALNNCFDREQLLQSQVSQPGEASAKLEQLFAR